MQLTEHEQSPREPPELVRVRQGNAAADADVLGGVLLEQIPDHPHEPAEQQPEQHVARAGELGGERAQAAAVGERERGHHPDFPHRKKCDEGERVHAGEVGLAIRDVHRAPQGSRREGGSDATGGVTAGRAGRRDDRKQGGAGAHENGAAQHAQPAPPPGPTELVEEHRTPQDAEQAVRVPQGEGDAEPDVADRKHGEGVGDGPQTAGEDRPDDEMRGLPNVRADRCGAAEQRRQAPAREKHAQHHRQRDDDRGEAEGDHLGRGLGGAKPRAGGEAAGHARELQAPQPSRVYAGGRAYRIHQRITRPPRSTATGTQNWASESMAPRRPPPPGVRAAPRRSGRRRAGPAPPRAARAAPCDSDRSS